MPRGQWSAEAAHGGQRGLVTKAGTVPYAQALAACRKAVRGAARQLVLVLLALPGLLVC
jgi:hypothetical protein